MFELTLLGCLLEAGQYVLRSTADLHKSPAHGSEFVTPANLFFVPGSVVLDLRILVFHPVFMNGSGDEVTPKDQKCDDGEDTRGPECFDGQG